MKRGVGEKIIVASEHSKFPRNFKSNGDKVMLTDRHYFVAFIRNSIHINLGRSKLIFRIARIGSKPQCGTRFFCLLFKTRAVKYPNAGPFFNLFADKDYHREVTDKQTARSQGKLNNHF